MKAKYHRLWVPGDPRPFVVDAALARKLAVFRWRSCFGKKYCRAVVEKGKRRVFLHNYILFLQGRKRWVDVYFANGDTHDCRSVNLKPYDRFEQVWRRGMRAGRNNTSGYLGVSFHRGRGKWQAIIRVRRKQRHLGYYDKPEQAAKAYRDAFALAHPSGKRKPGAGHK